MKLEELVPPLELCKLIPEGEFSDTALVWHLVEVVGFVCRTSGCDQVSGQEWRLTRSNAGWLIRAKKRGEQIYPAPLLEEIIPALRNISVYPDESGLFWEVVNKTTPEDFIFFRDGNITAAALKLWLNWKGIEDD